MMGSGLWENSGTYPSTHALFFLLPSLRASRKMPRSPRLAHKAPVQAGYIYWSKWKQISENFSYFRTSVNYFMGPICLDVPPVWTRSVSLVPRVFFQILASRRTSRNNLNPGTSHDKRPTEDDREVSEKFTDSSSFQFLSKQKWNYRLTIMSRKIDHLAFRSQTETTAVSYGMKMKMSKWTFTQLVLLANIVAFSSI